MRLLPLSQNYYNAHRQPPSPVHIDYQNMMARKRRHCGFDPAEVLTIRRPSALEAAGVKFIPENGGGHGVRLKKSTLPDDDA